MGQDSNDADGALGHAPFLSTFSFRKRGAPLTFPRQRRRRQRRRCCYCFAEYLPLFAATRRKWHISSASLRRWQYSTFAPRIPLISERYARYCRGTEDADRECASRHDRTLYVHRIISKRGDIYSFTDEISGVSLSYEYERATAPYVDEISPQRLSASDVLRKSFERRGVSFFLFRVVLSKFAKTKAKL